MFMAITTSTHSSRLRGIASVYYWPSLQLDIKPSGLRHYHNTHLAGKRTHQLTLL